MKALILAVQFMTRLPLPAVAANEKDFAQAIRWFPMAGIFIGLCVAGAAWAGQRHDPWTGALAALLVWVAITGALHLDGLGDIADAAGAAHGDRERLSAVLADPHIGSFGVTAIGLQLIAKLILLRLAMGTIPLAALAVVPVAARIGPLFWTLTLPPLHRGMGTSFGAGANWPACLAWFLVLDALAWWWSPALLFALPAMAIWNLWLRRKIGGISGDGHGAGIELVETATLALLVLAA
ncbi:MAG: adenosylcobinamide-GDP ribazoletransferase [Novosphingobium sp.]|uniref:Adenosylcobinamide-GDP ribazoletransferase n=1 Tax=Novosphingobium indicum TaxID=462949 RepID=A0ABQ2JUX2_9SPHN|nr:adenosylcobinamide-GDP ribazoletransferase [Novosphingobium indicum]MAC59008.1 adenosylcobinamide-GDP ribazoletransferase [Novosphingobium sp.]GGN56379.1 adenosylcobinamide-GDP ribazoletransferase [Novosphingobium indicum]|tara:strand:- start:43 stop:756 length:714 start_codon:yes stop_codon:yes gene_type:complete